MTDRDWSHLSPEGQQAPTIRESLERRYPNKHLRRIRRAEKGSQFSMVPRELMNSPAWLALMATPKAMRVYWFLVEQYHQNGGNQDDGLACPRRQFKTWCGGLGGDHDAANGLDICARLGLTVLVSQSVPARNPRYRQAARYALTTEPFRGNARTNLWRKSQFVACANELLAQHQAARTARSSNLKGRRQPRPPTPPRYLDTGLYQSTVNGGLRALPEHRGHGSTRAPSQGSTRAPSKRFLREHQRQEVV